MSWYFKKVSITITIGFCWLTFVGCAQLNSEAASLSSAHMVVNYAFPKAEDLSFRLRDTFHIYYYGKYIVYALPHKSVTQRGDAISNTISDHLWYIYEKGSKYGFELRSLSDTLGKLKSEQDVYLKEHAFASIDLPLNRSNYDSLVETQQSADMLVEQYNVKRSMKGQYFDTSYYVYSKKMDSIPYTFSRSHDSAHAMKLYKARFIFAPALQGNVSYPVREYSYELILLPQDKSIEKKIVLFIEKYKNTLLFN